MCVYVHTYACCITGGQGTNNSEILLKSISDKKQLATCWNFVPILEVMYYCPGLVWRADPLVVREPSHCYQVHTFSRFKWFCSLVFRHNLYVFF